MVQISVFKINQDSTALTLIASTGVGETITSLKLWNQDSFKDYTLAIDLTSKLAGTNNTESVSITLADISESALDGIYFVELVDTSSPEACEGCTNTALGVATDFARFQYCIIEHLCNLELGCANCDQELHKALTLKLYIEGLRNSLQLGNFTTAITFWKNLNRACKKACIECPSLTYITKKGLGFQTLNNLLILY